MWRLLAPRDHVPVNLAANLTQLLQFTMRKILPSARSVEPVVYFEQM